MDINEIIDYWLELAEYELDTAKAMLISDRSRAGERERRRGQEAVYGCAGLFG
jgi:hypothetical protein